MDLNITATCWLKSLPLQSKYICSNCNKGRRGKEDSKVLCSLTPHGTLFRSYHTQLKDELKTNYFEIEKGIESILTGLHVHVIQVKPFSVVYR